MWSQCPIWVSAYSKSDWVLSSVRGILTAFSYISVFNDPYRVAGNQGTGWWLIFFNHFLLK